MAFINYKPAQPLALQELGSKFNLDHKNLQQKKVFKSSKKFKESAQQLALDFGQKSTIHAMNRIFQDKSNLYERSFWLLTLILAFLGCIYVSLILSQRYNAGSLQTVVDTTNKPVYEIPFPEVTICNENHLNWERLEEAKERFMPRENNTERIRLFELVISLYDNLEFGEFQYFKALEGQPMALVNNINFSQVFDFMTWRCEEMLTDCAWHHTKVDCCDIFVKTTSFNGLCWHFNTLTTDESRRQKLKDDKYPWKIGSAGPKSGLTLRVLINQEKHYRKNNEKGLLVIITEPEVYYKEPFWIPANTATAIEVDPIIYFCDNGTRSVSSNSRQCLFNDERSNENYKFLGDLTYMFENCEAQCRQEYLLKYCNCTLDLLFPYDIYPPCKPDQLLCLAKNNDYFRFIYQFGEEKYVKSKVEGMVCNCFRNCYSVNYITDVRPSFLPRYLRDNGTYVELDVYFRFEKLIVYRTSLVFNWVDLMVAFGGIAGLFLGCSLISAIELIYFALVELPVFIYTEMKAKSKTESFKQPFYDERNSGQLTEKSCNWDLNNRLNGVKKMPQHNLFLNGNNINGKANEVQKYNFINKQNF